MEKNRICKICNRRFSNGKAMGGHMRSHLAKLPVPPKPIQTYNSPPKSTSSSSSLNCPLSTDQKPMQAARSMINRDDVPFVSSKPNLYDRETSETESPRNPTRRRSKRSSDESEKKALEPSEAISVKVVSDYSSEQVSSVTDHDILAEEDVALCLLMLSRDKWVKDVKEVVKAGAFDEYIEEEEEGVNINHVKGKRHADDQHEEEEEEEDRWFRVSASHDAKYSKSNKYRCKICKKGFKSYQALGGHKASHKKIKASFNEEEYWEESGNYGDNINNSIEEQRIFECPFCDKVFESGQALGGHKKVHFSYLPPASSTNKSNNGRNLLDLNLPAPEASTVDVEVG